MATKLSNFISDIGQGVKPNMFMVDITFPDDTANADKDMVNLLCKSAALPAQNIANIDVPFRGRTFKVAGDRTIDTWTVTVINDETFALRNAFEQWSDLIARLDNNLGATDPSAYMVNAKVFQLGRGASAGSVTNQGDRNAVLKEYEFVDIFPTNVSQIDVSYDSTDTIEEFTVEFQVQTFRAIDAGGPNG